eukprot:1144219-Amphidinium_carterae.1
MSRNCSQRLPVPAQPLTCATLFNIPDTAHADLRQALQPCRGMAGSANAVSAYRATTDAHESFAADAWPFTHEATREILEAPRDGTVPELVFEDEWLRLLPWETPGGKGQVVLDMSDGVGAHAVLNTHTQSNAYMTGDGIHTTEKRESITRGDDALTTTEMQQLSAAVKKAMLDELLRWLHFKCFSMRPRRQSANIVDIRWIIKWKYEGHPPVRNIRARLTVRGFKDAEADQLLAHATTASRVTQWVLTSLAVQLQATEPEQNWQLKALDVKKAFLQGVSYAELSTLTGEPLRDICFEVPASTAELIRQLPGFEGFNHVHDVLHLDKPGTWLKDAPRAFSLKFRRVTAQQGYRQCTVDSELELKHSGGKLIGAIAKHVDDVKAVCTEVEYKKLILAITEVFGQPEEHPEGDFVCVGLRHRKHADGSWSMDQQAYASAIQLCSLPELTGKPPEEPLNEVQQRRYPDDIGISHGQSSGPCSVHICSSKNVTQTDN